MFTSILKASVHPNDKTKTYFLIFLHEDSFGKIQQQHFFPMTVSPLRWIIHSTHCQQLS